MAFVVNYIDRGVTVSRNILLDGMIYWQWKWVASRGSRRGITAPSKQVSCGNDQQRHDQARSHTSFVGRDGRVVRPNER